MADDVEGSSFERKLESELQTDTSTQPSVSYSEEYKVFRDEQLSKPHTLYEKICRASSKLKVKVKDEKRQEIESYTRLAHLEVTPEGVYSFAYISTLVLVSLSLVFFFIFGLGSALFGFILSILAFLLLPKMPQYIYNAWRARASDQLVLAILYLVIYMKRESNLENAIWFVSKQVPPPISLDFMKILWDVETKKYPTVRESLETYTTTWKNKESAFVDSIHLVEAALTSPNKDQADSLLSKATDVILQGTQDSMNKYAHSLQGPITTIHMLGIVLPILLLVMMPLVGAFLGDLVKPYHLFLGYDIILPLIVFALTYSVIQLRPGGAAIGGVDVFKRYKKGFSIGKMQLNFPLKMIFAGLFGLSLIPPIIYFFSQLSLEKTSTQLLFSDGLFYSSLFVIAGLGLAIGLYYKADTAGVLKQKRKTEKLESEFSAAIFQLGSRIQENIPAEMAFGTVAKATHGTEVSEFFDIVDKNMRQGGMSLKAAILDNKKGAVAEFPSSTIRSVMNLLVEGVKKSPQAVAQSLLTISTYLTDMHRVSERLKDLLAETISSIKMQASFLAALISAIVVSLTVLVTKVLVQLSAQLESIPTQAGAAGSGLVGLFSVDSAIPPFMFQLMVGVYLVEVIILLSYLLSGVIYGRDPIEAKAMIARNLLVAIPIYILVTLFTSFFFSQIAGAVLGGF